MKRRKSMRTISLLIVWIVLCALGCQRTSERTVFYPIDDTKAYYITYKQDSIMLYKEEYTKRRQLDYCFYKFGDNYYTDEFGKRDLVMSGTVTMDTLCGDIPFRCHRIVISQVSDSLFESSIFIRYVDREFLDLRIIYDKDYHIKSVQDWTIWETYAPFVDGVQDTFVVKPNMASWGKYSNCKPQVKY